MNYLKLSRSFNKGILIALSLLLVAAALGNGVAHASGLLCVSPTGAGWCFSSIQSAVDAANDGGWITIRAGTYVEQVVITGKNVKLIGLRGATVQAPAAMEDTLSPIAGAEGRPIILVTDADVTIRGLTVDGANSAENNPFLQGITFVSADGLIRDNLVKDVGFGEPALPIVDGEPIYQGEGIIAVNFGTTPRTVTIAANQVINYNTSGITVFAETDPGNPTLANFTVNVVNNTVIGSGPNDVVDQWGIFFGGYGFADPQDSITGTIKGNRIQDQITADPYPYPGTGIVTFSTSNMEVSNNTIENVNIDLIANQASAAQIVNNQFAGRAQDPTGTTGLLYSGRDSFVSGNRFKSLEIGALLFIEDFDFGTAYSTVFDDNRFDKVTMDLLTGQGAPTETLPLKTTVKSSDIPNANILKRLPIR